MKKQTAWNDGKDKYFEHYRLSKSKSSKILRKWVDDAYYKKGLSQYLDKDFVDKLQNHDFYGRLWELELAEWFILSSFKMMPTNGTGPDFCIDLKDGKKAWIEAVLARPDDELEKIWQDSISSNGEVYDTPRREIALRYSTSLVGKADKIKNKYSSIIAPDDYTLIAISAFPPGALRSDIDLFMPSILPIEHQVIHFATNGTPLDPSVARPTHTVVREYVKKNGSGVKKEFLYPGDDFSFIDGVVFSEASNLQNLLGTFSNHFDESTNRPHIFANYSGKELPKELTDNFYYHKFSESGDFINLEMKKPLNPNSDQVN